MLSTKTKNAGESIRPLGWYGEPGAKVTLYRFGVQDGSVRQIARDAVTAHWSGDADSYVQMGQRLALVVSNASDHQVKWIDDLGEAPEAHS